jgi:hypothetical protein
MPNKNKPDFEHPDGEKIANLLAYNAAITHVQNLIKLDAEYGREISASAEAYNEAVAAAADSFYAAAVYEHDLTLQIKLE